MGDPRSLVQWYPRKEKNKCGYCGKAAGSIMFGMWAYRMKVEDYQDLIDRGWRRSGHYCYKPVMHETCCPLYTIRCHALNFRPTKSQKKVMKKMTKFLKTGELKEREQKEVNDSEEGVEERVPMMECPNQAVDLTKIDEQNMEDEEVASENENEASNDNSAILPGCQTPVNEIAKETNQRVVKKGLGPDPNRPPCKKAKILRYEKKLKKLGSSRENMEVEHSRPACKSIEEFLNDVSEDDKHRITMKLIEPNDPKSGWEKYEHAEYALYKKYQMVIHNDTPQKCSYEGFQRFLVKSPLKSKHHPDHQKNPQVPAFGSYHQQYWLDDKLIAVGVIDILPKCVSAVYFFYDPDYRELTLGTYGALKEIQLARELYPSLGTSYYYMGYYAHSCKKMRYKGNFHPSDLLCPETYQWFPIEKCLGLLDACKYCRFNEDRTATDPDECKEEHLNCLKIVAKEQFTTYKNFKNGLKSRGCFEILGSFIGCKLVKSLIVLDN